MTEAQTAIQRQVTVPSPIDRAFSVFTERFGDFKPPEHNMLGAPIAETVFEPRVGGNIVDRAADGTECRWARILAYEPPHRVVFSWGHEGSAELPPGTSVVEVRLTAAGSGTRVVIEHRDLPARREGGHGRGWRMFLDRLAIAAAGGVVRDPAPPCRS